MDRDRRRIDRELANRSNERCTRQADIETSRRAGDASAICLQYCKVEPTRRGWGTVQVAKATSSKHSANEREDHREFAPRRIQEFEGAVATVSPEILVSGQFQGNFSGPE